MLYGTVTLNLKLFGNDMLVTINDVMSAHGCAMGMLQFLKRHKLDYRRFFQSGGLPIEDFTGIDDDMLRKVLEQTHKRYAEGVK